MSDAKHTYLLSEAAPTAEIERLRQIDELMAPTTEARIARLGIARGWRCLEVGAGVGGVARWMAGRVGKEGKVTAVDLAPLLAEDPALPQLEVRRHDILTPGLEPAHYDLVHCRLLLTNVGNVELALEQMTRVLRPGGWLIAEEPGDRHYPGVGDSDPRVAEFNALSAEFLRSLQERSRAIELALYRRLPDLFRAAGLTAIGGEQTHLLVDRRGRSALLATLRAVEPILTDAPIVTEGRMDRLVELANDPDLLTVGSTTVALWGRRV